MPVGCGELESDCVRMGHVVLGDMQCLLLGNEDNNCLDGSYQEPVSSSVLSPRVASQMLWKTIRQNMMHGLFFAFRTQQSEV